MRSAGEQNTGAEQEDRGNQNATMSDHVYSGRTKRHTFRQVPQPGLGLGSAWCLADGREQVENPSGEALQTGAATLGISEDRRGE